MMLKAHLAFVLVVAASTAAYKPSRKLELCTLENGKNGYCVMSYLCKNGTINTDGDDTLDERSFECEAPKTCCELKDKENLEMSTTTRSSRTLVPDITPAPGAGQRCTAGDKSPGRCLWVHLCKNDTSIFDGGDALDERTGSDTCPDWRGAIQICCPESWLPPDFDKDPTTTEKMTTTEMPTTTEKPVEKDTKCKTKDIVNGICVPFYQCDEDYDGASTINVRYNEESSARDCPYTTKCCDVANVNKTIPPVTPKPHRQCGVMNVNGLVYTLFDGRVDEAKMGEIPWMVAVMTRNGPDSFNMSGGSLIHPSVVLTAAHYVVRALDQEIKVRAGEWDLETTTEPLKHQERNVRKIVAHPDFVNRNKHNDVALLFLDQPFTLESHIGVVCLPPAERAAPTTDCVANGWGKDKFGKHGRLQHILKKTILPVVERGDCQERLRDTRLGPFYRLHTGFMCAGGGNQDTCTADGGGPLACPMEEGINRYMVWGVVSWGIGCGERGIPGVYADVSQYRSWILDQATAEGIDLLEYDTQLPAY